MANPKADKILMKVKHSKPEKIKVSFSLDLVSFERFRDWCDANKVPQSRVIEELIKDIVVR